MFSDAQGSCRGPGSGAVNPLTASLTPTRFDAATEGFDSQQPKTKNPVFMSLLTEGRRSGIHMMGRQIIIDAAVEVSLFDI